MIDAPYQTVSFEETVTRLTESRTKLRDLAQEAWIHFLYSWKEKSAERRLQMNAKVEEAFMLARQTIDSLPEDILKIASDQSMKMGTFYHTRGGMPPREYAAYMYLGGSPGDFASRKGFAERNIERARKSISPYMCGESVTWEEYKKFTEPRYMDWPTPTDEINYIGDEFYVLTLILNKVPDYLCQSHEMMLQKFKSGNKKKHA